MFPKIGVPQNGWFIIIIMENPIKMDDLGVFPLLLETPKGGFKNVGVGRNTPIFWTP